MLDYLTGFGRTGQICRQPREITEPANPILLSPADGGKAGGNTPANPAASPAPVNEKIPENMTAEGSRFPGIDIPVPPQGLEQTCEIPGKRAVSQTGGVAGGVISNDLAELIKL